jgi:hypothetical protein
MDNPTDQRSLAQLITDLSRDATTLFRQELQLLKAELSENASHAGNGIIMVASGMVLALSALLVLLLALVAWLSEVMPPALASLIVGAIVAIIAYAMVKKGMDALKLKSLTPDRTVRQVAEDRNVVRERI